MNVLLLTSHAIAEYDDLRMLTDLGYDVFSIGGAYSDVPFEGKRPALDVKRHPELEALCNEQREAMTKDYGEPGPVIDWAKARVHPDIVAWADAIIVHHFPESWILGQWASIKRKRVIWRTCGQSGPDGSLERLMGPLRAEGLEIVRYSPNERVITDFAGEDALIRFGKYPTDYGPWTGEWPGVINITQHLAQRGDAVGYRMWLEATQGLGRYFADIPAPWAHPLGPGSEVIGGSGELTYDEMRHWLTYARVYVYTGTKPASYTLGLMEAMLSGIPIAVMPWDEPYPLGAMYEAPDIVPHNPTREAIPTYLRTLLRDYEFACLRGAEGRQRAIELFDVATVGPQWKAFLG